MTYYARHAPEAVANLHSEMGRIRCRIERRLPHGDFDALKPLTQSLEAVTRQLELLRAKMDQQ
jgi:hypothetical protein